MEGLTQTETKCGCFQVIVVLLVQATRCCAMWADYFMIFGNYEPPWKCVLEGQSNDSSTSYFLHPDTGAQDNNTFVTYTNATSSNYTMYGNSSCNDYPKCKRIEFESGSSTIITEFGLICDRSWIASLIISLQMFPVVPGAYIGGQVGETFGRKVNLYGSLLLLTATMALKTFSVNWEMYAVLNFVMGFATGCLFATCEMFTMEFLNSWWRATFTSLPLRGAQLILFALLVVWLRDWRLIHAVTSAVCLLSLFGGLWVPESLRWLHTHGKKKRAEKVVKQICRTNRLKIPDAIPLNEVTSEIVTVETDRRQTTIHKTYLDLFRGTYIRSTTLKLTLVWFSTYNAYTAMAFGIKSLPGDYYINVIISFFSEIPVLALTGPMANGIGRRWSVMIFLVLTAVTCATIVLIHYTTETEREQEGISITVLALIAKTFVISALSSLKMISVELYPTVVRNLAYGYLVLVCGVGGILAPYLIPQDPSWFGPCFLVLTLSMSISTITIMFLPETKGKPLEDVISEPERIQTNSSHKT